MFCSDANAAVQALTDGATRLAAILDPMLDILQAAAPVPNIRPQLLLLRRELTSQIKMVDQFLAQDWK